MAEMSRNGVVASCLSVLGTFLVLLALATKNWIVADGASDDPKIDSVGLWVVCFRNYEDPKHFYDTKFKNCMWVFEKQQYIIHDIIFKGFYSSTQILFSISFIFSLLGLIYTVMYLCFTVSGLGRIHIMYNIWCLQLASAIFGTISLVIFGVHGKSRDWMPEWEHKCIGWSYVVAVFGIVFLYICVSLFIIEERYRKMKRQKSIAKTENDKPKPLSNAV